jgi:hypothetical protein
VREVPGCGERRAWLVDTVDGEGDGDRSLAWLLEGARGALAAVAGREVPSPAHGRARRLVGLPALGTGWGGAAGQRGALLPWLVDCEGLGPALMRWYNPVVYASAVGALGGLLRENRSAPRRLGWSLLATVPLLVRVQHGEHRRLRALAGTRPGWWNRRLQEGPVSGPDGWAPHAP